VIEGTYALRSKLHHPWQIFCHARVHFVVQTCDIPMYYIKVWEKL